MHNVVRVAAGGDGDQDVPGLTQCFHLPFENGVKAVVIADSRKNGRIRVECDAGQWKPVAFKAANQFSNEMLGDRKSTRLNSSHVATSYAVFCLKKRAPCPAPHPTA